MISLDLSLLLFQNNLKNKIIAKLQRRILPIVIMKQEESSFGIMTALPSLFLKMT